MNTNEGFLDIGSSSWSILLACYFLTLHDDNKEFCITFNSILDILEILDCEFGGMIPLVSSKDILQVQATYDLDKLRDNALIEVIEPS